MSTIWAAWSNDWALYEKVEFNGDDRLIYIHPDIDTLDFQSDIYSAYIRWQALRDNSKYLTAMRYIGGDPIGGGQFSGLMFFLMNNWQIVIDHAVTLSGILYHDDPISPYVIRAGGGITNKVASLAYAYSSTGGGDAPTTAQNAAAVWAYANRSLSVTPPTLSDIEHSSVLAKSSQIPTVSQIATGVRTELTPELTKIMTLQNNAGLTNAQATMLLEMYNLLGLDPAVPLIVTQTTRTAGVISQNISTDASHTIVHRV